MTGTIGKRVGDGGEGVCSFIRVALSNPLLLVVVKRINIVPKNWSLLSRLSDEHLFLGEDESNT